LPRVDAYSIFEFSLRASSIKYYYLRRLRIFFDTRNKHPIKIQLFSRKRQHVTIKVFYLLPQPINNYIIN